MSASWFADKIEQWPTAKLLPYARNARTHSDDQVAPLAKPYPKSTRVKKQDSGHPSELGGAVPTDTLHTPHEGAR